MKKILINSKSSEETRIATLDNGKLIDLDIENVDREQKKANVYKGYISRIEPSLNAIFVNYGEEKNGFLPFKEVSEYYLKDTPKGDNIAHLLSEGQELIVQIDKEERGDKGAALTTFITLAGSYMVLLPNNPSSGGISHRVEGEDREKLKKYLKDLNMPKNMSVIARTACVECTFEELKHDFDTLAELWNSISRAYHKIKKPALLHKESDIIIRTVRDHLKEDVKEIVVDSKECFDDVKRQLGLLRQSFNINKVKLYEDDLPMFAQFGIDQQIENAYKREIRLPSGGSIVIDTTEALVAVDVNSSRANKAEDVETTAFKTNMEAAEEVARQLRIRDLGGLVIIDFIDMSFFPNRKQVEEKLMEALQQDKARIQMSRISKLGLVEISRQRLSSSLSESVMQKCPRCEGHGFIKTTQATALTILRKVRAEAMKDDTNEIRVQVPVDIAAYILNEKRENIVEIEKITNVKIMLIPNFNLEAPKFQMQRIWGSSYKSNKTSPELIEEVYSVEVPKAAKKTQAAVDITKVAKSTKPQPVDKPKQESPQVEVKADTQPKPQAAKSVEKVQTESPKKKGFFSKLLNSLSGEETKAQPEPKKPEPTQVYKSQKPVTNEQNKDNRTNDNKSKDFKNSRPDSSNRNEKDRSQKQEQRSFVNEQRDNNRSNRNENSHSNNKNDDNRNNDKGERNNLNNNDRDNNRTNDRNGDRNNKRNDKFDKKTNNKSNSNRNSNLNLNNAEEVVDITKVKYTNKVTSTEVDNVKKVISKNPEEFMSVMVTDVLENYDSLKDDGSSKVTTAEKGKTHKYLKFNIVSVDAEINATETKKAPVEQKTVDQSDSETIIVSKTPLETTVSVEEKVVAVAEITDSKKAETKVEKTEPKKASEKKPKVAKQEKPETKIKAAPKQQEKSVAKEEFINYSPAVDFESQSIR